MYRDAVRYKDGSWLAPGSRAFELYHSKDPKARQELDKHLKQLDANERTLLTKGKSVDELITLAELLHMLEGLSAEQLFHVEGVKPHSEVDGVQRWLKKSVEQAIRDVKNFQPHQMRVVLEKKENDERLIKLGVFIETNPAFNTALIEAERQRLLRQRVLMAELSQVLGERINAFNKEA